MSDDDQGFFDAIAAAPDEPGPYLIYSDALQLRGDPRGDLISIQHALETAPPNIAADLRRREAEIFESKLAEWLPMPDEVRGALAVRWRFGFVNAARILHEPELGEGATALWSLLAAPHVRSTLAELRIGAPGDDEEWPDCQAILDELALGWPPSLRRLHVCDLDLRGMSNAPAIALTEDAKSLDTLVVQTSQLELQWDATPPKLRRLVIGAPQFEPPAIREWPNLESLVVWTADPSSVLSMLSRAKLPRLRRLGLCGTANTPVLAAELGRHPILQQLETLDLRGGVLTMTKALQAFADRVKLDVRWNRLGKKEREQLGAFGAQVHPQRRGKGPLTDPDALAAEHLRVTSAADDFIDDGQRAKRYRRLVASAVDPTWLYRARSNIADDFPNREKRDALADLVREQVAELVTDGLADAYYTLGDACDSLVEGFEAETWLWQCVNQSRWEGSGVQIRALGLIGTTRMRRGDPVHAATIMDRVLAHYMQHGNRDQQAWALRQRGNVDLVRSEYATAETFYRRALELYRKGNDRHNEGIVLSELAGVLWSRQDFEGAVAMVRESITMRPDDSLGLGSCYYNLGALLNGMGKIPEAIEAGEKSLAVFRKHQRRDGEGQALSLLGELAQRDNRHDDAQRLLDEALVCHRERGAIRETGITLGNLARVALDRARWPEARARAEEAIELHRECGNKYNEGMQLMDCIDAAIGERRLDDALALATEALVPLRAIENLPGIAAVKSRRGYVAQLRGDFAAAERDYDEAIDDTKRGNYPELVGWAQLYRALIRAQQGRRADTDALVGEASGYLGDSTQGTLALAMARAVIARMFGETVDLPEATTFDARLIASFAPSSTR